MTLNDPTVIGDYRATLGETPVWCYRSRSLLWVDIAQRRLLRYWPEQDGRIEIRELPFLCSAALLTELPEHFLLATAQGIILYDYATHSHSSLCGWPETHTTRPNEAAVAPDGSLWFSTMDVTAKSALGGWYRFATGDAQPVKMLGGQHVPNTLVWHNGHAWFADTFAHYWYQSPANVMSAQTLRAWPLAKDIFADGSTLTNNGKLINARWGGSCLAIYQLNEYAPTFLMTLPVPLAQPTSCAFGGADLKDLYVTSATEGLKNPSDTDGALLRLRTSSTGQHATLFKI